MLTDIIAQLLYVAIGELPIKEWQVDPFFIFSARFDLREVWS